MLISIDLIGFLLSEMKCLMYVYFVFCCLYLRLKVDVIVIVKNMFK